MVFAEIPYYAHVPCGLMYNLILCVLFVDIPYYAHVPYVLTYNSRINQNNTYVPYGRD